MLRHAPIHDYSKIIICIVAIYSVFCLCFFMPLFMNALSIVLKFVNLCEYLPQKLGIPAVLHGLFVNVSYVAYDEY